MRIFIWFYNILLIVFLPVLYVLMLFVFRRRGKLSMFSRFVRNVEFEDQCVWLHCSSVGEVNSVRMLASRLIDSGKNLVMTVFTDYGCERAKSLFPKAKVYVLPLDLVPLMRRFVKRINPEAVLFYETEVWPSLFYVLLREKIPCFIISGKISSRSFWGYKVLGLFLKGLFSRVVFLARSEEDAERARSVGFARVKVVGDLKFDVALPEKRMLKFAIDGERKVLLWGSIHRGEEKIALELHKGLKKYFPELLTIIAPRHPGYFADFSPDLPFALRTESKRVSEHVQIYVIDTVGELASFYRYADVVLIGGSFVPGVGGHNPLEAVFCRKPVVIGEYHDDFRHIVKILNNGIVVTSRTKLFDVLKELLENGQLRREIADEGYNIAISNRGVAERILGEVFN